MMLQLTVTYDDGRRHVVADPMRDEPTERERARKYAALLLDVPGVAAVRIDRVTRYAGGGKGRGR